MTGNPNRSWNSTDSFVAPALLASIEVAWVTTWIGALASTKPVGRLDVPFLALALLAALSVALSGLASTVVAKPRWRGLATVVEIVVVSSLGAGALGSIYLHSSFLAVSLHPWNIASGAPGIEAGIAWFASSLAVLRGAWLGSVELSSKQVAISLGLASAAFAVFFAAAALHHRDALLRSEVHPAVVLLLLAFPVALALIAVVSERDLERSVSLHRVNRARLGWIVAIIVPMIAVAGIAALLVVVAGPGLPLLAHLGRDVGHWLVDLIDDLASWLGSLVHLSPRKPPKPIPGAGGIARTRLPKGGAPLWIALVAAVVAAAGFLAMLVLCFKTLRQLLRRRQGRVRPVAVETTEERDSVFSWSHLLDQIRALLARWRHGHGRELDGGTATALATPELAPSSVRHHYRQLLLAARAAGVGRRPSETPSELRVRLTPGTAEVGGERLAALTSVYERARYGDHLESDAELAQASEDSRLLIDALLAPVDSGPSAGVPAD